MLRYFVLLAVLICTAVAARAADNAGYYQGKLGSKQTITLRINAAEFGWAGQYRYTKYGSPIWLSWETGHDDNAEIQFKEIVPHATDVSPGHFHGSIDASHAFVGHWTSADGKRVLPFQLERTADLIQFDSRLPRYRVQRSAPQFIARTPFYTALNAMLLKEAKDAQAASVAEFEKSMRDLDDSASWSRSTNIDVVYADANLVSLNYERYEFTGGAHGNIAYDSAIYTWRDNTLVELDVKKDLLRGNSRSAIAALLVQDLKRQKAGWTDNAKDMKLTEMVINPTNAGLVFTFGPYEVDCYAAGTYTVMLPYKSLAGLIKPDGALERFVDPQAAKPASDGGSASVEQ